MTYEDHTSHESTTTKADAWDTWRETFEGQPDEKRWADAVYSIPMEESKFGPDEWDQVAALASAEAPVVTPASEFPYLRMSLRDDSRPIVVCTVEHPQGLTADDPRLAPELAEKLRAFTAKQSAA